MVALEADDLLRRGRILQAQDVIHHALGVRPPVDVVPHEDQLVPLQVRLELLQEALQGVQMPVNVADGVNVALMNSLGKFRGRGPGADGPPLPQTPSPNPLSF